MALTLVPTQGMFQSLLHRAEGTDEDSEVDLYLLLTKSVDLTRISDTLAWPFKDRTKADSLFYLRSASNQFRVCL